MRATLAIFALAMVLRVGLVVFLGDAPLHDDARDYHEMAVSLAGGAPFEPDWPPGLPALLLAAHTLFGASVIVDRAVMIAVFVGFGGALFALAERLGGRRAANLALLFVAVQPSAIYASVTPLTQLPTAALLTAAALFAHRFAAAPRRADAVWLALCLAGLILVRPSNLLLAGVVPLALFWRTRRLSALIAPAVAVALLLGAWTWKAHEITGRWLLVNNANSQNIFYGNNPWTPLYKTWAFGSRTTGDDRVPAGFTEAQGRILALPMAERDHAYTSQALEHITARPDLFVVRSLARVRTFFAFDTFTGTQVIRQGGGKLAGLLVIAVDGGLWVLMGALAILYLCAAGRAWILLGFLLLYAAPYFLTFSHPTYHFPVVGLVAVAAAVQLSRRLQGERLLSGRSVGTWVVLAAFAAIQVEWVAQMFGRAAAM